MSNILNHNKNIFELTLNREDYWDFHIAIEQGYSESMNETLSNRCLSSYIDFNDPNCIWFDDIFSKNECVWEKSVNNGIVLNNIGYTGIDNGMIPYQKDRISNQDFLNIFLKSQISIDSQDNRLKLHKINGNNGIYDYSCDIIPYNDITVAKFNGGFYQGVFKINDDYQVLPTNIGDGWGVEFTLQKKELAHIGKTLNDKHPNNKGIFFYIGTRAENKWIKYYNSIIPIEDSELAKEDNPFEEEYMNNNSSLKNSYIEKNTDFVDCNNTNYYNENYIDKIFYEDNKKPRSTEIPLTIDYVSQEYYKDTKNCQQYVEDDYIEDDINIDENMALSTTDGYNVKQPNIIEYKTDNKFILFNQTKDGFTIDNWDENTEVILHDIKIPEIENYFILFNQTKNGYTTETIGKLIDEKNKMYNYLSDLYRNSLCFQITDNGEIGYKYLIKDCNSENGEYSIESEFSYPNIINDNEWANIFIKIVPNIPSSKLKPNCTQNRSTDTMQIYFYVNGSLKFVSKRLPILQLRKLNDLDSKQETVPFNISVGGGTQGLCDVVYPNFRDEPTTMFPLEKEFGGSFIGYIKTFRFYTCPLTIQEIKNNYHFETELLK